MMLRWDSRAAVPRGLLAALAVIAALAAAGCKITESGNGTAASPPAAAAPAAPAAAHADRMLGVGY